MKDKTNPTIKMVVSFLISIMVIAINQWYVSLWVGIYALVLLLLFSTVAIKRLVLSLGILLLLSLAYFFTGYLFPGQEIHYTSSLSNGFINGLNLSLRIAALGLLGLGFSYSLDKNHFISSLIQQLKLPMKIAYSVLAAINLLDLIEKEYKASKLSLRMRSINGVNLFIQSLLTMLIRMVRLSETLSLAMEAKGFSEDRTHLYRISITSWDCIYLSIHLITISILLIAI